jgi:hypothetical protein
MQPREGAASIVEAGARAETCASCKAPLDSAFLICRYCGAPVRSPESVEEQRQALLEYRHAFQQSLANVTPGDFSAASAARERFFQHALIPDNADLIIDEAVFCRQSFDDDTNISKPARTRFEALILKLSLVAEGDARTLAAVETLKRELKEQRHRERAYDSKTNRIFLIFIAAVALGLWLLIRACTG